MKYGCLQISWLARQKRLTSRRPIRPTGRISSVKGYASILSAELYLLEANAFITR